MGFPHSGQNFAVESTWAWQDLHSTGPKGAEQLGQ